MTQHIYTDKLKQVHSLFKSGCRLEGSMSALNALGIVTKPVPSFPRPAPAGFNDPGSSEMQSRIGTSYAMNHRPPSPANFGPGGSPDLQSEIQPALSAELLQLLNDNPEELQRLLNLRKKGKGRNSD